MLKIIHKIDMMPFPMKKRDFVFINAIGFAADGTMFMVQRSLPQGDPSSPGYIPSHPSSPPESDRMVRGHMYATGFRITPLPPQNGCPQVKVMQLVDVDPGGSIPPFFVAK